MAKSRDRVGRETKKPKKDDQAKALTRSTPHVPMTVDVVPRKRKPREEEEDEE